MIHERKHASAASGQKLWAATVEVAAQTFKMVAEIDL